MKKPVTYTYRSQPPDVPVRIVFRTSRLNYQYLITSNVTGDKTTIGAYSVDNQPDMLTITPVGDMIDFDVTILE